MLSKKHLPTFAEALADYGVKAGLDEEETVEYSMEVCNALLGVGGITPEFDRGMFGTAVREAYRGI